MGSIWFKSSRTGSARIYIRGGSASGEDLSQGRYTIPSGSRSFLHAGILLSQLLAFDTHVASNIDFQTLWSHFKPLGTTTPVSVDVGYLLGGRGKTNASNSLHPRYVVSPPPSTISLESTLIVSFDMFAKILLFQILHISSKNKWIEIQRLPQAFKCIFIDIGGWPTHALLF